MHILRLLIILILLPMTLWAQPGTGGVPPVACPPNIDFEFGNLNNWKLYTGFCCPIATPTLGAITCCPGRHTITSGTATDYYGGFPIVSPAVGLYSLKLGNSGIGSQAERARYYIRIPASVSNYSIYYRYAIVLQDPSHQPSEQPRFEVSAFDSATGTAVPCTVRSYVASGSLPGFTKSTVDTTVWYLPWTFSSLNLSGRGGTTVAVDFSSGDCSLGGHFGYGYIDISCGLFNIDTKECNLGGTTTLSGPPGFDVYTWMNDTYTTTVATGQTVSIPTPSVTTTYKLVLTPYTGFGCPDTLSTTITVSNLAIHASADTMICRRSSVKLYSGYSGGVSPYTFEWLPSATVSCSVCDTTIATPTTLTNYVVKVTDGTGCYRKDTVKVVPSPYTTIAITDVSCFGLSDGSAVATTIGLNPFTYAWNTSPVNTTTTITGKPAGAYRLIVTDVAGCKDTEAVTIAQPVLLTASATRTNVSCNGGSDGIATVAAQGGTAPYTYSWNTTPAQTTAQITGLAAGIYTATVTDAHGCIAIVKDTITEPTVLTASIPSTTNVSCYGGRDGTAASAGNGGTLPYSYSWNTTPIQTTPAAGSLPAGSVTVTITDGKGCIATANATITQPPVLTAAITAVTNIDCYGYSTGKATVTAGGGTTPYTYSWNSSPVQTTATATGLRAGAYHIVVTDAKGCTAAADTTLIENTQLVLTPTSANVSCYGGSNGNASIAVTGGISAYTYSWNTTPVNTNTGLSNLSAGSYTVTVTDIKSCTASRTIVITQPALLTATITPVHVTCNGFANGIATANVSGGTTPYRYSWNTTPVRTTGTITGLSPGSYTVSITDTQGCTTSANTTITQPDSLKTTTTFIPVSCYAGTDGRATVTATGGSLPYSYSWGSTPVQTTATATSLYAGTYPITVTDGRGCTSVNSATVTQPTQLVTTATTVNNVSCYGNNNGSIGLTVTGGTSPYNYLWLSILPLNLTATATGLAPGSYGVKVTDAKGCINTIYTSITQPPVLTSSVTSTDVLCNGANNGTATVTATGGTTPYTYAWNTTPAQTISNPTGIKPGSYKGVVTDANGCTTSVSVIIKEPTALIVADTSKNVTCYNGNDGSINITVTGGVMPYTYTWNSAISGASASGLVNGNYTVTVTDANLCTKSKIIFITQPPKLLVKARPVSGSCPEFMTGAADVMVSGGIKPYNILWNDPASSTTSSISKLPAGQYKVTVKDSNNCISTDTVTLPLWPSPSTSLSISDSIICVGKSILLTARGALKFLWTPPGSLPCDTCISNTTYPKVNTLYTVIGYNTYGCTDTANAKVEVIEHPQAVVDPEVKICVGDKAQLNAYDGLSYEWSPAATLDKTNISNPVAKPDSTTTYRVIVKENKCFTDTLSQTVTVYPYPEVDAGKDVAGLPGATMQFQGSAIGADKYEWSPNLWLSCIDCLNPMVTPKASQKYMLKATSPGGCFATDTVWARIACDGSMAYLPNTFSPNGDGQNDIFYPRGDGFTTIMNFRIVDRWGEVIYKASNFLVNNKDYGWNGMYNNAPATPGVYVYVLEVGCPNNTTSIFKGDVTLLR